MAKLPIRQISFDEHNHDGRLVQDPASWAIVEVPVASLVTQVWETIICFPEEVEYLWRYESS
uniref:DUF6533 domain-containing protein n=1 Tax=Psilocybe cubensis TaxID=181762 RepID=A0A8H7XMK8_PSICU